MQKRNETTVTMETNNGIKTLTGSEENYGIVMINADEKINDYAIEHMPLNVLMQPVLFPNVPIKLDFSKYQLHYYSLSDNEMRSATSDTCLLKEGENRATAYLMYSETVPYILFMVSEEAMEEYMEENGYIGEKYIVRDILHQMLSDLVQMEGEE